MSQIALWIRLYSKDVKRRAIVMWKKVIAVVMMIGIMGGTDIRALASEESSVKELQTNERDSGISIMTLNTAKQNNKLLISSTHVATVYCYIAGSRDVTKTSISATLQKRLEVRGQMSRRGQQQQVRIRPVLEKQKMLLAAVLTG